MRDRQKTLTTVIRVFGAFVTPIVSIGAMLGAMKTTTNCSSFSEVAFKFRITPALRAGGLGFAALMGAAGGLPPARRAARIPMTRALREIREI